MRINTSVFKRAFCQVLAAFALFLTACGDRTGISDLDIVIGFGFDQDGQNVRITAQLRKTVEGAHPLGGQSGPGGGGGNSTNYINFHASGSTVAEAVQNLRKIVPRRLFFAHNTVVVFGRQFARKGISPALDFLLRSREFRRTQLFCVTSGTARDVLTAAVGSEQVNALELQRLLLPEDIEFFTMKTTEIIFMNELLSPSHTPIMSWVDVEGGQAILKGVGLFRGDRLAELLPTQLAQSLFLLRGQTQTYTVNLPCKEPDRKTIIRIRFIQHRLNPVRKGGDISFHVRIRGSGEPVTMCRGDYLEPETIKKMEKDANRIIKQQLRKTVAFLQQRRLDGAMWGSALYRTDPQWWREHAKEWPNLFAKVPVKMDVQVNVSRSGMLTKPPEEHYTPELFPPKSKPEGGWP